MSLVGSRRALLSGVNLQRWIDYCLSLGNCQGVWPLNEATGTRRDYTSNGNHLTASASSPTRASGPSLPLQDASQFTAASSQYLSIADNASLSTADTDFTLCAWVYFDSLGAYRDIVAKNTGTDNQRAYAMYYDITAAVNQFAFEVNSTGEAGSAVKLQASTFGTPATATWIFVVAWHDSVANTINIQVNNGAVDSMAHAAGTFDSTAFFGVGASGFLSYMNGRIAGVAMLKRVLTSSERTNLYNLGKA